MIYVKREVFFGDHGEPPIQIGPSRDYGTGLVEIYTSGKDQEDYWGKISISLQPDEARELARALIDAAKDAEESRL